MKITIKTEPSIFLETMELVSRFVNGRSVDSSRRDYLMKFSGQMSEADQEYFACFFDAVEQLMEEGTAGLNPKDPLLQYYFRDFQAEGSQQRVCLAKVLLHSFYEGEGMSFAEGFDECRRRHGEFSREDFSHYRIMDIDPGGLNMEPVGMDGPVPLHQQLDAFDLSPGDKWEIYRNLRSYDAALAELRSLLAPVAERVERILKRHAGLLEKTAGYWSSYFRDHTFQDLKSDMLGVEPEPEVEMERVVWFWWMGFGQVHCYQSDSREALNIGVLVRRENMPKSIGYVQSNVQNILRLLGDKSKFDLLRRMKGRRCYGLELAGEMNLTSGTISKHLNALFSSGLLTLQRVNNRVYYQTDEKAVRRFLDQLALGILGEGVDETE